VRRPVRSMGAASCSSLWLGVSVGSGGRAMTASLGCFLPGSCPGLHERKCKEGSRRFRIFLEPGWTNLRDFFLAGAARLTVARVIPFGWPDLRLRGLAPCFRELTTRLQVTSGEELDG